MLKQLALTAIAALALSAAVSSANATGGVGCPVWMCGSNGTLVTGSTINAEKPTVESVTLPSGKFVNLR